LIDQLNFEVADFLVDAGTVFLDGGWRSGRTTNGAVSVIVDDRSSLKDLPYNGKRANRFGMKPLKYALTWAAFVPGSDKDRTLVPQAAAAHNQQ
jgi:hypothetical protein